MYKSADKLTIGLITHIGQLQFGELYYLCEPCQVISLIPS